VLAKKKRLVCFGTGKIIIKIYFLQFWFIKAPVIQQVLFKLLFRILATRFILSTFGQRYYRKNLKI